MRLFILLAILALTAIASAEGDRIVAGPYDIAFDLSIPKNYTTYVMAPLQKENYTSYSSTVSISNETRFGIYIYDLKSPEDSTVSTTENLVRSYIRDLRNATARIGKIDGTDGIIVYYTSPEGTQMFLYKYWIDSKKIGSAVSEGSTEISVAGEMPINSSLGWAMAESLLRTLHIEKTGTQAASGASISVVLPATRPEPYLRIFDQDVQDSGGVRVDAAFINGPGKIEIYNDPIQVYSGYPIGSAELRDGLNENVIVTVNMAKVVKHPILYAVIKDKNNKLVGDIFQFHGWPYPGNDFPDWKNLMSQPYGEWL